MLKKGKMLLCKFIWSKVLFLNIKMIDGVVGNSSSGILEVPSFKKE